MAVTTRTALTSSARLAGTFVSTSFTISNKALRLSYTAALDLASKAAVPSGEVLNVRLDRSADNGATWMHLVDFGWVSYGPTGFDSAGVFPDPFVSLDIRNYKTNRFRITATTKAALVFGVHVDVST